MQISGGMVPLDAFERIASGQESLELAPDAATRMDAARRTVEAILAAGTVAYGINTGFGKLADVRIGQSQLEELQVNLVRSHACGIGTPLSAEETRLVLALRANVLATGRTGVRPAVAERLLELYGAGVLPWIPSRGSVGASGDLAPLAHVALTVIGEGHVHAGSGKVDSGPALKAAGLAPIALQPKEGLSLVNGTQVMLAVGGFALARARRVAHAADVAAAMSLEALKGTPVAYDPRIVGARPHPGAVAVATVLRCLLEGSEIRESHAVGDARVQDAYSLRCVPQVHGTVHDALAHVAAVAELETASATDNPLVFAEDGDVLSGGNFHGAPLALGFDHARAALAVLASISERRIDRLVNPDLNEGLTPFLSHVPGLESGLMMPHVLAAALVNELRTLSHPASVDNTSTSGGKEDHVSMGMTAALLLRESVAACAQVVAIELFAATEGIMQRAPLRTSAPLRAAVSIVHGVAPPLSGDRSISDDLERLAAAVLSGQFSAIGAEARP